MAPKCTDSGHYERLHFALYELPHTSLRAGLFASMLAQHAQALRAPARQGRVSPRHWSLTPSQPPHATVTTPATAQSRQKEDIASPPSDDIARWPPNGRELPVSSPYPTPRRICAPPAVGTVRLGYFPQARAAYLPEGRHRLNVSSDGAPATTP